MSVEKLTLERPLQLSSLLQQRSIHVHKQVCVMTALFEVPGCLLEENNLLESLIQQFQFLSSFLDSITCGCFFLFQCFFLFPLFSSSSSIIILAFAFCLGCLMLSKNGKLKENCLMLWKKTTNNVVYLKYFWLLDITITVIRNNSFLFSRTLLFDILFFIAWVLSQYCNTF